jgi:hypothetical protein
MLRATSTNEMDTLRLKPRAPVTDMVENWDDDDFDIGGDDFVVQSRPTTSNTNNPHRRDSHSSFRSDLESMQGEEEKQVHLPGDDEKSTLDAIATAVKAGIPIPKNVPPSALTGGTIKRLGGRKLKKIIQEDWGDDLELPGPGHVLQIKQQDGSKFPEILRQVSSTTSPSPSKSSKPSLPMGIPDRPTSKPALLKPPIILDRFRDTDDDDDFFGGDGADTIKLPKRREFPKPVSLVTPPTPQKSQLGEDDFEMDLELPSDGKLKLSSRRDIPKTPSLNTLDDLDWAEGSLGTRFGGTRRDGRSNRSSSVSALSPSVTSSFTAESEDEAFNIDLVLPEGPIDFRDRLNKRRVSRSPERILEEPLQAPQPPQPQPPKATPVENDRDDFLDGLDLGDGEVFSSKKLTLHRNVQLKETRAASPSRPKTAVALKFTTKPVTASRLPRPLVGHERSHTQSSLEPVSESGGPIPQPRRSISRLGHSSQSSVTSIGTPTTPSSGSAFLPSTPRRREVGQKTSTTSLRNEPTTTSAQLLRLKRSLPAMATLQQTTKPSNPRGIDRPPSRTDRSQSTLRPKTPVERLRTGESAASQARRPAPFLPAGASTTHSHNINAKSSRVFRRTDSCESNDLRPSSRTVSRSTMRSPSPRKHRQVERIGQDGPWQQLSKPRRVKQFGDGHELDGFDDLPTSVQAEARFMKQPAGYGLKTQARKVAQRSGPDRTGTPSPLTPYSPARMDQVPSFARDTAASRIARETSLALRTTGAVPPAPLTTQRVAQLSSRGALGTPSLPQSTIRSKKPRKMPQLKPYLIANLNPPKQAKCMLLASHVPIPMSKFVVPY